FGFRGWVTITNVTLHDNSTDSVGGAIAVEVHAPNAMFVLRNSQVYSNAAPVGGGIYLNELVPNGLGVLSIQQTEIYSNTANQGGGIDHQTFDINNSLVLSDSRVHHNHADTVGGGVKTSGFFSLLNSTLDWNDAGSQGGGLYNSFATRLDSRQ